MTDGGTPSVDSGSLPADAGSPAADSGPPAIDSGPPDIPCAIDMNCAATPSTPYCDVLGHVCVSCISDLACQSGEDGGRDAGPFNNICLITHNSTYAFSWTGAACTSRPIYGGCLTGDGGNPCAIRSPDQPICSPVTSECVQCLSASDCPSDGGYCCDHGACTEGCSPGTTNCDGTCADLSEDPSHCGTCGNVCAADAICTGSACMPCVDGGEPMRCGRSCVDVSADSANCGACANACGIGISCIDGACAEHTRDCDGGPGMQPVNCGGTCVDLANDESNCGLCNLACNSTETCSAGSCTPCPLEADGGVNPYVIGCNGACLDVSGDPENCGACGNVCPDGNLCASGWCARPCAMDLDCMALPATPYCDVIGKICVACTTNAQCAASDGGNNYNICVIAQNSGWGGGSYCDSINAGDADCATHQFCPRYPDQPICNATTGDCVQCLTGTDCPAGYVCNEGGCTSACPSGLTSCDGLCDNLYADRNNCGGCGTACPGGEVCLAGTCGPGCAVNEAPCNGACIDVTFDPNNCGNCGVSCGSNEVCSSGNCVQCPAVTNGTLIAEWGFDCGNVCINLQSDPDNCGSCGAVCGSGQVCVDAFCAVPCQSNTDCAGTPSTPICDVANGTCAAANVCTPVQQQSRWAALLTEPIVLPNGGAGLNLAGFIGSGGASTNLSPYWQPGDPLTWAGLTLDQASQVNCEPAPLGPYFGGSDESAVYFGGNAQVVLDVNVSDHVAFYLGLNFGYLGELDFACTEAACGTANAATGYKMRLDGTPTQISPNGTGFTTIGGASGLDWVDAANGNLTAMEPFDLMYRALIATFTSLPPEPTGVTCNQIGQCELIAFPNGAECQNGTGGAGAVFYIPALGWSAWVQPDTTVMTSATICRIELDPVPLMSFTK